MALSRSSINLIFGIVVAVLGITAGASCPNILIDDAVLCLFQLRGVNVDQLIAATEAAAASAHLWSSSPHSNSTMRSEMAP